MPVPRSEPRPLPPPAAIPAEAEPAESVDFEIARLERRQRELEQRLADVVERLRRLRPSAGDAHPDPDVPPEAGETPAGDQAPEGVGR